METVRYFGSVAGGFLRDHGESLTPEGEGWPQLIGGSIQGPGDLWDNTNSFQQIHVLRDD